MTTHSQGPPPWVVKSFMYPLELFCRDEHRIPVRSADHKKGGVSICRDRHIKKEGSFTSLLLAVHSRVRNEKSFMYPHELFCRDKHLSGFCVNTPNSRNLFPTLPHQVLPHTFCSFPSEVLSGLQEGGRTIRHRTTLIHEDTRVERPTLLIPLKPIGPSVLRISQPTVSHEHPC